MGKEDKKQKKQFEIPDPAAQLVRIIKQQSKYKIGEVGYNFYDIRSLKPIFAFDYLSLSESHLCFNYNTLNIKDYVGFLDGLKKISSISYDELSRTPAYRFHPVSFDDSRVVITRKEFKEIFTTRKEALEAFKDEELPTLYQFDLQYVQEARVCGFLFRGIFYLVWYDRNHKIYKKQS